MLYSLITWHRFHILPLYHQWVTCQVWCQSWLPGTATPLWHLGKILTWIKSLPCTWSAPSPTDCECFSTVRHMAAWSLWCHHLECRSWKKMAIQWVAWYSYFTILSSFFWLIVTVMVNRTSNRTSTTYIQNSPNQCPLFHTSRYFPHLHTLLQHFSTIPARSHIQPMRGCLSRTRIINVCIEECNTIWWNLY